jgi:type IV secretory pathway VirJ component
MSGKHGAAGALAAFLALVLTVAATAATATADAPQVGGAATQTAAPASTHANSNKHKKPTATKPVVDPTEGETHLPAGRFGTVTVYIPEGTPKSVAIFLSGDGGWNLGVISMAKALVDMGAVVIGVDIRQYLAPRSSNCHSWATASRSSATGCRSFARPTPASARIPKRPPRVRWKSATCL